MPVQALTVALSSPAVAGGKVFVGSTAGYLAILDAATGARIWTRNSVTDTGAVDPGWGFTSSPLVFEDKIIVAASGVLIAYDIASGEPRHEFSPKCVVHEVIENHDNLALGLESRRSAGRRRCS